MNGTTWFMVTFAIVCGIAPAASQTDVPKDRERPDTTVLVFNMANGDGATFYLQRSKDEKKCKQWCVQGMVAFHASDARMAPGAGDPLPQLTASGSVAANALTSPSSGYRPGDPK
jgi:hypothetical protein